MAVNKRQVRLCTSHFRESIVLAENSAQQAADSDTVQLPTTKKMQANGLAAAPLVANDEARRFVRAE